MGIDAPALRAACALLASFWLCQPAFAQSVAAAPPLPSGLVDIRLDGSFPAATRRDLLAVARDVLTVTRGLFRAVPPAGIRPVVCYHRPEGPMTDSTTDPAVYRVGVSVASRDYARFAYQLAHELGHVYLDPRRTNGLLETLAVAVSLQVLDGLSQRWERRPPYGNWRSYAPQFRLYRERVEHHHLVRFPAEVQEAVRHGRWNEVALYLAYRRDDQDANAIDRDLNVLGALTLRTRTLDWPRYLGAGSHTHPSPEVEGHFRDDLPLDLTLLPQLAGDLRRIGRTADGASLVAPRASESEGAGGFRVSEGDASVWLVAQGAGR